MTPSRGPQRPSRLASRTRSETAPPRFANGATDDAADPRPGVTCAPSASLTPSAPFRSPDRHRLLDCPALNVFPPRTNATASRRRRQAIACRRRLADPNDSGPHAPVGSDARGGTTPLGIGVRFVRKAHSRPNAHARPNANALRSPRHPLRQSPALATAAGTATALRVHVVSRRPRPASGLFLSHRLHGFRV